MENNKMTTAHSDLHRETKLDGLRILLSFLVILLHVSAGRLTQSSVDSSAFRIAAFFNSPTRCSVPVFIMLSGYFRLSK